MSEDGSDSASQQQQLEGPSPGLKDQVARWGTPRVTTNGGIPCPESTGLGSRLEDQAGTWATPNASDGKRGSTPLTPDQIERGARILSHEVSTWPTPVANDDGKSPEAHLAMKARMPGGKRSAITSLSVKVQTWPTPTTQDGESAGSPNANHVTLHRSADCWPTPYGLGANHGPHGNEFAKELLAWPTPNARDHKGADLPTRHGGTSLAHAAETGEFSHRVRVISTAGAGLSPTAISTGGRRRLNPAFVCWLMGWPWWWTRAEPISSAAAGTESSRYRRRLLSACCSLAPASELRVESRELRAES